MKKITGFLITIALIIATLPLVTGVYAEGNNFEIENGVLKKYTGTETKVEIPEEVTSIEDKAFFKSTITSVIITKNVKTIGIGAFYSCESLANITFEYGIETIGMHAFFNCPAKEIFIPSSIKTINERAFGFKNGEVKKVIKEYGEIKLYGCSEVAKNYASDPENKGKESKEEIKPIYYEDLSVTMNELKEINNYKTDNNDGNKIRYNRYNSYYKSLMGIKWDGLMCEPGVSDALKKFADDLKKAVSENSEPTAVFDYARAEKVCEELKEEFSRNDKFAAFDDSSTDKETFLANEDNIKQLLVINNKEIPENASSEVTEASEASTSSESSIDSSIGENSEGASSEATETSTSSESSTDSSIGENSEGAQSETTESSANSGNNKTMAFIKGDADISGTIDANDALQVLKNSIGVIQFSDAEKSASDVNFDGNVNAQDALIILEHCVGKYKIA